MASLASASTPAYLLPGIPVVHPPHLEGDPALATEILPGPPPLASVQQSFVKKDAKKPLAALSYLPMSDPGSTYGGLALPGLLAAPADNDGPRRKRARTERAAASRAQRASNRSLNAARHPASSPGLQEDLSLFHSQSVDMPDLEASPLSAPIETPALSRGSSEPAHDDIEAIDFLVDPLRNGRNRGKGKEKSAVRVKDEPVIVALPLFDPATRLGNDDHCSACRTIASGGGLVYCDSCPRAFHFMCLDPPIDQKDMGEGDWHCPHCTARMNPPSRLARGLLAPLIQQLEYMHPLEYALPDDIRGFYKDVATDPRGAYIDTSQVKQPRLDRHGRAEEPEPYRLRDRSGLPMLCFHCGKSSLPHSVTPPTPSTSASIRPRRTAAIKSASADSGQTIVSCDYCDLHWHLDCVDPPMASLPPPGKKWMCPAHADKVTLSKHRTPKHHNAPIDITQPNQKNNGNIEVIPSETAPLEKLETDDVVINGRRYRIPERVITLDFWNRIAQPRMNYDQLELISNTSTLTSLSSDEEDGVENLNDEGSHPDLHSAQLLLAFARGLAPVMARQRQSPQPKMLVNAGVQTVAAPDIMPLKTMNGTSPSHARTRPGDLPKSSVKRDVPKIGTGTVNNTAIALPPPSVSRNEQPSSAVNGSPVKLRLSGDANEKKTPDKRPSKMLKVEHASVPSPPQTSSVIALPGTPQPKVVLPAINSTPSQTSTSSTIANGNPPSSTLKIRLPRMGGPQVVVSTALAATAPVSISQTPPSPSSIASLGRRKSTRERKPTRQIVTATHSDVPGSTRRSERHRPSGTSNSFPPSGQDIFVKVESTDEPML